MAVARAPVEPVGAFEDLAFHGLAHVPLRGPESLFDARYVAWCAGAIDRDAREPLASDGPAIGAELDARGAGLAIQWLPRLHLDVASFSRVGERELAMLGDADGCDAGALRVLRTVDPVGVEWLRADLLLAARAFGAARAGLEGAVRRACEEIAEVLASVRGIEVPPRIGVALALGARGRGFADGVVVGAHGAWNGLDAATPAVLAIHEHAVVRASGDHTRREWRALTSVARAMGEQDGALRVAHARWLASLDLDALCRAAERAGMVEPEDGERVRTSPRERAEVLARIARPR